MVVDEISIRALYNVGVLIHEFVSIVNGCRWDILILVKNNTNTVYINSSKKP